MKPGKSLSSKSEKFGLTIVFENWTTPVVAIVMLLAGLTGGFFARPFINTGSAEAPSRTADQNPSDLFVANVNHDPQGMMEKSVKMVRHWRGDSGAPIRLVEFADYQ